jgi:hypothetical protein
MTIVERGDWRPKNKPRKQKKKKKRRKGMLRLGCGGVV